MASFDDIVRFTQNHPHSLRHTPFSRRFASCLSSSSSFSPFFFYHSKVRGRRYVRCQIKSMKMRGSHAAASGRNNESKYGQWKTTGHKRTKKRSLQVTKDRAEKSTVNIQFGQTRGTNKKGGKKGIEQTCVRERSRRGLRAICVRTRVQFSPPIYCRKPPDFGEPISTVTDVSVICRGFPRGMRMMGIGQGLRPEIISSLLSLTSQRLFSRESRVTWLYRAYLWVIRSRLWNPGKKHPSYDIAWYTIYGIRNYFAHSTKARRKCADAKVVCIAIHTLSEKSGNSASPSSRASYFATMRCYIFHVPIYLKQHTRGSYKLQFNVELWRIDRIGICM